MQKYFGFRQFSGVFLNSPFPGTQGGSREVLRRRFWETWGPSRPTPRSSRGLPGSSHGELPGMLVETRELWGAPGSSRQLPGCLGRLPGHPQELRGALEESPKLTGSSGAPGRTAAEFGKANTVHERIFSRVVQAPFFNTSPDGTSRGLVRQNLHSTRTKPH